MVNIKPICRQCFAQAGYSVEILPDLMSNEYVCKKNPRHRFKKEEDGSFSSL
jgi:hypothetical protein